MLSYWCRRLGCSFLPLAGPGLVWGLLMWSIAAERGEEKFHAGSAALIDAHHTQCGRIPPKERHVTTETWMTLWNHCSVRSYFSLVFAALLSIISFKERYSIDEGKGGLLLNTGFSFSCFDQLQRRPPIPGTSMKTGSLSWPSVTKLMHSQRGEWVGE